MNSVARKCANAWTEAQFGHLDEVAQVLAARRGAAEAMNADYAAAAEALKAESQRIVRALLTKRGDVGTAPSAPVAPAVAPDANSQKALGIAERQWSDAYDLPWGDLTPAERQRYAVAVMAGEGTDAAVSQDIQDAHLSARFSAGTRYSQGRPTLKSQSVTRQQIQNVVDAFQRVSRFALPIRIVANPAEAGLAYQGKGSPPGALHNGKIYLFTDGIESVADAAATLFHEVFHYGISKSLSPEAYHAAMRAFSSDPTLAKYVSEWKATPVGQAEAQTRAAQDYESLAAEEAMARISEELTANKGIGARRGAVLSALAKWMANLADSLGLDAVAQALRRMTQTEVERFVTTTLQKAMGAEISPLTPAQSGGTKMRQSTADSVEDIPAPDSFSGIRGVLAGIKAGKWRVSPGLLGMLTNEQLADTFKAIPAVRAFRDVMNAMAARTARFMTTSDAIKREWESLRAAHGKDTDLKFAKLLLKATTLRIWPGDERTSERNAHLENTPDVVAQHARLQAEYNALPKPYHALFEKLAADFAARRQAKVAAVRAGLVSSYYDTAEMGRDLVDKAAAVEKSDRSQFIKSNAKNVLQRRAMRDLWETLDAHANDYANQLRGPYFPLVRFGDHIVSYDSAVYREATKGYADAVARLQAALADEAYSEIADAEDVLTGLRAQLKRAASVDAKVVLQAKIAKVKEDLSVQMGPINKLREAVAKQAETVAELKSDSAHHGVTFFSSLGEAVAYKRKLESHFSGKNVVVSQGTKDVYLQKLDATSPAYMNRLANKLDEALPQAQSEQLRRVMRELYYEMQPDTSALKSQLKRMNVAGARADEAMRAYATSAMRDAWAIGRLEYKAKLMDSLNELRFNKDDPDAKIVGNELAKRVALNMTYSDHPWINALSSLTYLQSLGLSPSFLITNATQPWFVTAPVLAARHGMAAIKDLGVASKQALKLLKVSYDALPDGGKTLNFSVDLKAGVESGAITPQEAAMLQYQADAGRIDITIRHDLGAAAQGSDGGKVADLIAKAASMSSTPAQQIEVINRVATALAGYRAELAKTGSVDAAYEYAGKLVTETHLNYAAENKARFMHPNSWGGWGRIMFQFRAYQQGMLYLVAKNTVGALKGDPEARKAAMYLTGTMLAAAGTSGLPGAAAASFVATALYRGFTDDDDEKDLKTMLRHGLSDAAGETFATLVLQGAPAAFFNLDLSKRVGMGSIASPLPFVDDNKTGRDMAAAYWISMTGGAAGGMVANWLEAINKVNDGHPQDAIKFAAPKVLADLVRGSGMALDGLVDSKGTTFVKPTEVTNADVIARLLGMDTATISELKETRAAYLDARFNIKDARTKLLRQAIVNRASVADEIAAFNRRHPGNRITAQNIFQAKMAKTRYERSIRNGVPVGKKDRELAAEFGLL